MQPQEEQEGKLCRFPILVPPKCPRKGPYSIHLEIRNSLLYL